MITTGLFYLLHYFCRKDFCGINLLCDYGRNNKNNKNFTVKQENTGKKDNK